MGVGGKTPPRPVEPAWLTEQPPGAEVASPRPRPAPARRRRWPVVGSSSLLLVAAAALMAGGGAVVALGVTGGSSPASSRPHHGVHHVAIKAADAGHRPLV